ncbi:MAG: hypothetical protein GVY13_02045 [Alphaproteobacteria bacterium]|jgi:flagellin|nr:hypothetical protein [Alphaproteobacteria bacterium]
MPAFSVLTNTSAMNALFKLNQTQKSLDINQSRINTGFKVGSAKDDAATFVVAQGMRSDVAGFKQVRENMSLGLSTLGTATKAAEQINEELVSIKEKIIQASNQETGRADIQTAIDRSIQNIQGFTGSATFNGINLIDGLRAQNGEDFEVVSSMNRDSAGALSLGKISVAYQDLSIEETDRGLGMVKDINVTAGKATETLTSRDDPVSISIDLAQVAASASSAGESFDLTFVDADGEEQTITFEITSSNTDAGNSDFKLEAAAAAVTGSVTDGGSFAQALSNLMADGGALAGLGFSVSGGGAGSTAVQINRNDVGGEGQLVGFEVADGNTELDSANASTVVNESAGGNVQAEIEFNATTRDGETNATQLKAGDEIDLVFNDGTNDHKFTLVVGEDNEFATTADGTQINGSANKYQLSYESAVTKDNGDAVTVSELANRVKEILLNEGGANADMNSDIDGASALNGSLSDFTITNNNNKVTIVDTAQGASDTNSVVGFNMNSSTGGSLDFDFMLEQLNAAEAHLNSVQAQLGSAEKALESQDTYMESLVNAVEDGIGTLVDANMAEESAKFQALQVQQQLGLQALGIANSQPQSILSLFG